MYHSSHDVYRPTLYLVFCSIFFPLGVLPLYERLWNRPIPSMVGTNIGICQNGSSCAFKVALKNDGLTCYYKATTTKRYTYITS